MLKYEWSKNLNQEQLDFLIQLPYTISLPINLKENVIIVHAGLVAGLPLEKHSEYDMIHMRNIVYEDYYDGEGIKPVKSNSIGQPWAKNYRGDHVYFGHNSKLGLQISECATGLDTGCVGGNYLTGVFIKGDRKGKFVSVKSKQNYKIKNQANDESNFQTNDETNFQELVELDAAVSNLKANDEDDLDELN